MRFLCKKKYIIPRLILCGLAVAFLALASRPIIRSIVLQSVQSLLGAQANVADVRTSLWDSRVRLVKFSAADFCNPEKTLFRADAIELELDRDLLLQRKCVVRRGRVLGLELVADHENAPAIDISQDRAGKISSQFRSVCAQWLERVAEEVDSELESDAPSVKLAEKLLARWPDEYDAIESKSEQLKERAVAVRQALDGSSSNPLRNLASYEQAIGELDSLGLEIFDVRRRVEDIRQQMEVDRSTISRLCDEDLAQLRDREPLETIDEAALTEFLLSADVAKQLNTVIKWVQLSRRYTPTLMARHSLTRRRGQPRLLPGMNASPDVLVETLVLQGTATFGNQPVNIEGTIQNLSSNPQALGKPTEFTIQTTGRLALLVQGTLDATGDTPHHRFVIDCPSMPQESKLLGDSELLAVVVAAAPVHVWANVSIIGDALQGEVLLKQRSPSLTPQFHPQWANAELARAMDVSLADVESIDVSVQISGSLASPHWELRSNLGSLVADGMRMAVESRVASRRERQVLTAHDRMDEQVRVVEMQLLAKQQAILESLQFGTKAIERTRQDIANRVEVTGGAGDSPLR